MLVSYWSAVVEDAVSAVHMCPFLISECTNKHSVVTRSAIDSPVVTCGVHNFATCLFQSPAHCDLCFPLVANNAFV
jgi:hypothetical protein